MLPFPLEREGEGGAHVHKVHVSVYSRPNCFAVSIPDPDTGRLALAFHCPDDGEYTQWLGAPHGHTPIRT